MAKEQIVKMLLGNSEEHLNNIIEKLTRDVLSGEAVLEATRTAKAQDFTRHAWEEHFDLIVLMADGLKPGYRPQGSPGPLFESTSAIRAIKKVSTARILAFSSHSEDEPALLEAGAEHVLGIPFKCEEVKTIVRRMVTLPSPVEEPEAERWSFGVELLRGWRRFAQN